MLENKLELTSSSSELVREEERISKKKAMELFEKHILDRLPEHILHCRQFITVFLRIFTILPVKSAP